MERKFYYSNWYLVFLIIFFSCATTNDGNLEHSGTALRNEHIFFAKNKAITLYSDAELKELYSSKQISEYLYDCASGRIDLGIKKIYADFQKKNTEKLKLDLGNCYYIKGNYSKASIIYSQVTAITKNSKVLSLIYNNLALAYAKRDFYQQAVSYFREANKLDPFNQIAEFNLAIMNLHAGEINQAATALNTLAGSSDTPYISGILLAGISLYQPNSLQSKVFQNKHDKFKDLELYEVLVKSRGLDASERRKLIDGVESSRLTRLGVSVKENYLNQLNVQLKNEKDRDHIHQKQSTRALGDRR